MWPVFTRKHLAGLARKPTQLLSVDGVAIPQGRLREYYRMDHTSLGGLGANVSKLQILPKELHVELASRLDYAEHIDKECEELDKDTSIWRLLKVIQLLNSFEETPLESRGEIDREIAVVIDPAGLIEHGFLTRCVGRIARSKGWQVPGGDNIDPFQQPTGFLPILPK